MTGTMQYLFLLSILVHIDEFLLVVFHSQFHEFFHSSNCYHDLLCVLPQPYDLSAYGNYNLVGIFSIGLFPKWVGLHLK